MSVTATDIQRALHDLGLGGRPVCLHASLRSFGHVTGGGDAVVEGFLAAGCTLLVPTFTSRFAVRPCDEELLARNAFPLHERDAGATDPYTPDTTEVDAEMGAIPAAVARWSGHVRGDHPLDSFSAVGPLAWELVHGQQPEDVYAPLRELAQRDGSVTLAGVGLERLTLLHLAEAEAGRVLFRRWAAGAGGRTVRVAVGGCSEGFGGLAPALEPLARRARVGESRWMVLPAAATLEAATRAIRANPEVTRCADPDCERCRDAIAGGPMVEARP